MNNRINYAISIKHWCDAHPKATDAELVEYLERIEKIVSKDISKINEVR